MILEVAQHTVCLEDWKLKQCPLSSAAFFIPSASSCLVRIKFKHLNVRLVCLTPSGLKQQTYDFYLLSQGNHKLHKIHIFKLVSHFSGCHCALTVFVCMYGCVCVCVAIAFSNVKCLIRLHKSRNGCLECFICARETRPLLSLKACSSIIQRYW